MAERVSTWRSKPSQVTALCTALLVPRLLSFGTCTIFQFLPLNFRLEASLYLFITSAWGFGLGFPAQLPFAPRFLLCSWLVCVSLGPKLGSRVPLTADNTQEVVDLLQQVGIVQLFLVQRPGPTSFVVREEGSEVKRKVQIGSRISCSW